jgi:hypothetical protein
MMAAILLLGPALSRQSVAQANVTVPNCVHKSSQAHYTLGEVAAMPIFTGSTKRLELDAWRLAYNQSAGSWTTTSIADSDIPTYASWFVITQSRGAGTNVSVGSDLDVIVVDDDPLTPPRTLEWMVWAGAALVIVAWAFGYLIGRRRHRAA